MLRQSRRLALLALVLLTVALPAADGVKPRWQLKKGQVLKYLLRHHEDRTVSLKDEKFETRTELDLHWEWTVDAVDEKGTVTLKGKLAGLRAAIAGRGYEFAYDSNGTNASEEVYKKDLISYMDQLRSTAYTMRLSPEGQVIEISGFDKSLADMPPGSDVHSIHGYNLRDGSFAWYLQQSLGVLPDVQVQEGGRWKQPNKNKLAGIGELTGETEYRLTRAAKAGAATHELGFEGAHAMDVEMKFGTLILRGPMKIGKVRGTVQFDPKTQTVQSSEYKAEMRGDFKLNEDPDTPILKMEFKQTVTLETRP